MHARAREARENTPINAAVTRALCRVFLRSCFELRAGRSASATLFGRGARLEAGARRFSVFRHGPSPIGPPSVFLYYRRSAAAPLCVFVYVFGGNVQACLARVCEKCAFCSCSRSHSGDSVCMRGFDSFYFNVEVKFFCREQRLFTIRPRSSPLCAFLCYKWAVYLTLITF